MSDTNTETEAPQPSRVKAVATKVRETIASVASKIANAFKRVGRAIKRAAIEPEADTVISAHLGWNIGLGMGFTYLATLAALAGAPALFAIFTGAALFELWLLYNSLPILGRALEAETFRRQMGMVPVA